MSKDKLSHLEAAMGRAAKKLEARREEERRAMASRMLDGLAHQFLMNDRLFDEEEILRDAPDIVKQSIRSRAQEFVRSLATAIGNQIRDGEDAGRLTKEAADALVKRIGDSLQPRLGRVQSMRDIAAGLAEIIIEQHGKEK